MGKAEFEARFGFVPVMDVAKQKRRSVAKWLAEDKKWMEKHGFILIEAPAIPEITNNTEMELPIWVNQNETQYPDGSVLIELSAEPVSTIYNETPIGLNSNSTPKKRGRKPKQS